MATLTSHTLNSVDGTHAGGIAVELIEIAKDGTRTNIFRDKMDEGGRLSKDIISPDDSAVYELVFKTDVLLWAKGLAIGAGLNVNVDEPDVSPLAIQGPKAEDLMAKVFGEAIRDIGFFKFDWFDFKGTRQLIARSGYSKQGGFEVYLQDGSLGSALWDAIWEAGIGI
ncbi:Dimethylsulfonioproprionate demethylase DmdA [Nymphon striatum]|nr:Dimethylsulfonioproprionate demethylase DmdA [Nymphon striatum]